MLKYKNESSFDAFYKELLLKCETFNSFANYNNLLPYKELVSTAKSIAKFCWKEFSNEKLHDIQSKNRKQEDLKEQKNKSYIQKHF